MSKHTPGPWNVCEPWPFQPDGMRLDWGRLQNLWIVGTRPGVAVAAVDAGTEGTAEANARLIAQAPAMLEALIELWEAGEWVWSDADNAMIYSIKLSKQDHNDIFIETAKNLTNAFDAD